LAETDRCLVSSAEHSFSPIFYGNGPNSSSLRHLNAVGTAPAHRVAPALHTPHVTGWFSAAHTPTCPVGFQVALSIEGGRGLRSRSAEWARAARAHARACVHRAHSRSREARRQALATEPSQCHVCLPDARHSAARTCGTGHLQPRSRSHVRARRSFCRRAYNGRTSKALGEPSRTSGYSTRCGSLTTLEGWGCRS
jgi:hypothetical protein